jgi:hypothetical protein
MKIKKFQDWLLESSKAPILTREEVLEMHFSPVDQFTAVSDSDREVTVKLEKSKDEQFFCTVSEKGYTLDWSAEPYASEEDAVKEFKALTKIDVVDESFSAKSIRGYSSAKEKWDAMDIKARSAYAKEQGFDIEDMSTKFDLLDTPIQVEIIRDTVGSVNSIFAERGRSISEAEEIPSIDKAILDKYRKYSTMNEDQLKREIERMSTQKKSKSPAFDNDAYRVAYYYLSQKATEAPGASAAGSANTI